MTLQFSSPGTTGNWITLTDFIIHKSVYYSDSYKPGKDSIRLVKVSIKSSYKIVVNNSSRINNKTEGADIVLKYNKSTISSGRIKWNIYITIYLLIYLYFQVTVPITIQSVASLLFKTPILGSFVLFKTQANFWGEHH